MIRTALAAIASAAVLFFFGFLWWGVLMPVVQPAQVITDEAFVQSMSESLQQSGLYFYPNYAEPVDDASRPMAIIYYNAQQPSMAKMMAGGFLHMLVVSALVCAVLPYVRAPTFGARFCFVFFLGLFVAAWADLGAMVWWRHPSAWAAFHFGYDVLSWLLAGLVIAAIAKPAVESQGEAATP